MREIRITNNLTNRKEVIKPVKPATIGMYACGITTYDHSHIGHAMQAIFFDIIRSYLEYAGYKVTYVRNYTDVDDKIIQRAKEKGVSPQQLAKDMVASCEDDFEQLEVRAPDHAPKVSESIPDIIEMIEELIANGAAYSTTGGDVYYRVRAKADYGKLSNRKPDELRSGSRDIVLGDKEDELDFALWKNDDTLDASWESPWGRGRPGWHIECSAMARRYLGKTFDIHGGGRDLIFPHHENEIAQSESANQATYVNYWTHCGLMTIEKQKMSKSLGNHLLIKDFLRDWSAEVLRLALMEHHYTSNVDFSLKVFRNAVRRLLYYYRTLADLDRLAAGGTSSGALLADFDREAVVSRFHEAMSDDFNTAVAIGDLNKVFKRSRDWLSGKQTPELKNTAAVLATTLRELYGVLGLLQQDPKQATLKLKECYLKDIGLSQDSLDQMLEERRLARAKKDFATADRIRNELVASGIEIMDTPEGPDWTVTTGEIS